MSNLSDVAVKALENILEIVVPHRVDVRDIGKHLRGYDRQKAIETILERAIADPLLTKVKLMAVYGILDAAVKNGGL